MVSLAVDLAPGNPRELRLGSPIIAASGCFGFGPEYSGAVDVARLGAFVCPSITLRPSGGSRMPRIADAPAGMLSAIGLENPGLRAVMRMYPPIWEMLGAPAIVSIAGDTIDEFAEIAAALDELPGVAAIEVNLAYPVRATNPWCFGWDPDLTGEVIGAVRSASSLPIIAKFGPGLVDAAEVGQAAEAAGADAVSPTGPVPAMAVDVRRRRSALAGGAGGLSGPAIRPIAVKAVSDVAFAVALPVVGGGGVACVDDVLEFLMAGASAVQVGTAIFAEPRILTRLADELEAWMLANNVEVIEEIIGAARLDASQGLEAKIDEPGNGSA